MRGALVAEMFSGLSYTQVGVWVVAGVAVLWAVYRLGAGARAAWPAMKKFVATVDALAELPEHMVTTTKHMAKTTDHMATTTEHMGTTTQQLGRIEHEMFPNGGNSLRDQTDRIEARQLNDHKRIKAIEAVLEREGLLDLEVRHE